MFLEKLTEKDFRNKFLGRALIFGGLQIQNLSPPPINNEPLLRVALTLQEVEQLRVLVLVSHAPHVLDGLVDLPRHHHCRPYRCHRVAPVVLRGSGYVLKHHAPAALVLVFLQL